MPRFIDLVGQKFGRLTVVERLPPQKDKVSRAVYWKCKCDCGNETVVRSDQLRQGIIKSCGCLLKEVASEINSKNLIGNRYGSLVVIEKDSLYKKINNISENRIYWKCKCDCGNIKTFSSHVLQKHEVFSCGCKTIKSKGEKRIQELLENYNVSYKVQYNNENMALSSGRKPRFDFAIIKNGNVSFLLEYNGEQHYQSSNRENSWNTEENLQKTQKRDKEKEQICKNLNIPLEIISYKDYSRLEEILLKLLKKYNIKE